MAGFPEFFDLPVYRLPREQYNEELRRYIDEQVAVAGGPDRDAEFVRLVRDEARKVFGGPWQYNEIIGFIRLHFIGSQVRGEYFAPDVKRIVKTRRKVFWLRYYKLAREIEIPARATGEEIFDLIKKYIDACRKKLPRRFIDVSQLTLLGPYVDWRGLYEATRQPNCGA